VRNFSYLIIISFFLFNISISNEIKIVYVDMNKILNTSLAGKKILEKISIIDKKNSNKFKKIEDKLIVEEKKIKQQKNILSKDEFQNKVIDLRKNASTFSSDVIKSKNDLIQKKQRSMNKLIEILNPILSDYASKNSISIILQKKNIIIGKKELDVTNEILTILNKKITNIKIN
tara:strand:+ start:811 stop:1332 length:522 start_codon:yes stop_codon:yes gene_type:complete